MDSQTPEGVGAVEPKKSWTDAVIESFRPSDHYLSDEEIYEILNADWKDAADLSTAKGVTLPMYCAWRTKYKRLSLEELRQARRWQLWRARCVAGALVVAAVVVVTAIGVGVVRVVQAQSRPVTATVTERRPVAAVPQTTPPAPAAKSAPPPSSPTPTPTRTPMAVPPAAEPGYKIQVAAAPTVQEARELLDQLKSAGYSAYLSQATVKNAEVFRVRVGPFETLSAAEKIASQLHRNGHADAWIAR